MDISKIAIMIKIMEKKIINKKEKKGKALNDENPDQPQSNNPSEISSKQFNLRNK